MSGMKQEFRVVIVDAHPLLRTGLRAALTADLGVEVVGESGNGRDAIHAVECAGSDFPGHEFGVKSCLREGVGYAETEGCKRGCAGLAGGSA